MSSSRANSADDASASGLQVMNATTTAFRNQFEDLQQLLSQAQQSISRLEGAQEIIVAQNNELKKENDQLRLRVAQAESKRERTGSTSNNNTVPVLQRTERQLLTTQQAAIPQQTHGKQTTRQQTSGQRTDGNKEERNSSPNERNRKRRHRAISHQEGAQSGSRAVEFLDRVHASTGKNCININFVCTWDKLLDDLSSAHEPTTNKRTSRAYLQEFVNSAQTEQWFCFRDICESGKRAIDLKSTRTCPSHGPKCDIMIKKDFGVLGYQISLTTFRDKQSRG
ncbi:hypothetical protein ACHAPI_010036 [Fusarium lateritium]